MRHAISIRDLSKVYKVPSVLPWRKSRRVMALSNVQFNCPAEKITCLLGPNGAGKTTIIKILAGIVLPEKGEATILGESIFQAKISSRGKIGLLTPNERSFYWRLTGYQNLDFFASLYGITASRKRNRIAEVLSQVNLETDAHKPFRLYSSGMKQRLSLARALLPNPEIFLFDEPTTHLDPLARAEIHAFIKNVLIAGRHATVLICTHDLSEAQKLADHIVLLNEGSILAEGSMESLRRKLHTGFQLVLEFETRPSSNWLKGLPVSGAHDTIRGQQLMIEDLTVIPQIVAAAINNGGKVTKCVNQEKSLEQIFSEYTGGNK